MSNRLLGSRTAGRIVWDARGWDAWPPQRPRRAGLLSVVRDWMLQAAAPAELTLSPHLRRDLGLPDQPPARAARHRAL